VATSLFEIDLRERKLTLHASTGEAAESPLPSGIFEQDTNIERFALHAGFGELLIGLPGGDEAIVELRSSERPLDELRAGRPAVYLDQNHWSTLAATRVGHRKVSAQEACAAERLAQLVEAKEILLPVSAAHLVETTPLYGERRTALAKTVLQLGRGWQMRNPLHVRVEEILRAVEGRLPVAADVFAPQADGFFGSPEVLSEGTDDVGGSRADLATVLPRILGMYEAVVDAEAIPDEGGVAEAAAADWAGKYAGLAAQLHAVRESPEMVRRVANGNLIVDLLDDVVRVAGLARTTPEEVINRLATSQDPVSQMPFLAQMRQLLFARLRNKSQKWESNDLIDIVFLTCAAGYADIVVGERRTIGYLRQARTPRPSARFATSLHEAVALLHRPD
jgi:hypothetical protein